MAARATTARISPHPKFSYCGGVTTSWPVTYTSEREGKKVRTDERFIASAARPDTRRRTAISLHSDECRASRRQIGLRRHLECGNLYSARGLRFCARSSTDRRWPRLFQGPKLPSEWRCRRQWRDPGERCQWSAFRIWLRQAVEQFRLRKLAVIQRRMLRQLVSLTPRRLLLRVAGKVGAGRQR